MTGNRSRGCPGVRDEQSCQLGGLSTFRCTQRPFRKLLSYRQKKDPFKTGLFKWKQHDFAKLPTAPNSDHFANFHWPSDLACPPSS